MNPDCPYPPIFISVINNPQEHHRRSIRLKGYDYTQPGAYFVTLCAWQLECLFGEIVESAMHLNAAGRKVAAEWNDLPRHFRNIRLGAFVVMPNHVHGIVMIHDSGHPPPPAGATHPLPEGSMNGKDLVPENPIFSPDGSPLPLPDGSPAQGPPPGSLGAIIGQFKSRATKRIWTLPGIDRHPIWQRNYYEHIIRNDQQYQQITEYIQANPLRWQEDQLNGH